jgi:hypothetical protein
LDQAFVGFSFYEFDDRLGVFQGLLPAFEIFQLGFAFIQIFKGLLGLGLIIPKPRSSCKLL